MKRIIEVCCGSYEDALAAYDGGASRIELNSALYLGGLTPSVSALKRIKQDTDLEVICMIRPRGGGFHYSDEDYLIMKDDCELLLENGADGIAFGILDEFHNVDRARNKELVDLIHRYNKTAVFHRAIDVCLNIDEAMIYLIEIGVDRILTSGQEAKAMEGKECIKHLQSCYGEDIEILPGSGINASNALEMMEYTGVDQVHSSCKSWKKDVTTSFNNVSFSYEKDLYDVVDVELVRKILESI